MTVIVTAAMAQLNFSNDKVYTLTTTRGWLIYNPDNDAFVASTASYRDFAVSAENTNCQWAIHKSASGKYYLYNVGAGKFIGRNSDEGGRFPWVESPTNDIQIVNNATGNEYAYVFSTDNYGAINHFNHTTAPGVANWKSGGLRQLQDAGSAHKVEDAGSIDAGTLAEIERLVSEYEGKSVVITYEFTYEGDVKFTQTTEAVVGEEYPSITVNFPLGVTAQKPAGTVARGSETTIAIPLVVGELPFEYAASYGEVTAWYNLVIHATDRRYVSYNPSGYLDASSTAVDAARAKSYTWAFVGNPVDGFSIVNRLSGKNMVLTSEVPERDDVLPYMAAKSHIVELPLTWDFKTSQYGEAGFFIAYSGTNICLNRQDLNGDGLKVCYWLGGADAGSTFFVEECDIEDTLTPEEDAVTEGEIVDLGLSVKWRAYNVDASSPEELGTYYLWSEADIAQTHLGGNWYMPTMEEGRELIEQCTWEWMSYNGAYGYKVTGPNGNSIFMPAGGWVHASSGRLVYFEVEGNYWTSTYNGGGYAYDIEFNQAEGVYLDPAGYIQGWQVVRPVYHAYVNELDEFKEDKCYTITCGRGAWTVADERFKTTNDAAEEVAATNANQHFAVLSLDGENYYLYSVAAGKFVKKDGSLVAGVADPIVLNSAVEFGIRRTQIQFKNTNLYVNINGEGSAAINGWSDIDEGNAVVFTEVGDFDAADALELLNKAPENTDAVARLDAAIAGAQALFNSITIGAGMGEYTATDADYEEKYATIVAFRDAIQSTTVPTPAEVEAETAKLNALVASFRLNLPEAGKYYRILAVEGWNDDARYLGAQNSTANATRAEFVAEAGVNTIFYFDGSQLVSYSSGNYLASSSNMLGYNGVQASGSVISFQATTKGMVGAYNIKFNNGTRYLYCNQDNYTDAGNSTNNLNGYCFNIEEVETLPVSITAVGYATFFAPVAVTVPAGVTAYTVTIDGDIAVLNEIGAVIPANTGVVLAGAENAYDFAITGVPAFDGENALRGTVAATNVTAHAYVLGAVDGVGFYTAAMTEGAWLNNSHKAYLPKIEGMNAASYSFRFGEGATEIEELKTENGEAKVIFDLTGRKVNAVERGIYIVNGKKVLVK